MIKDTLPNYLRNFIFNYFVSIILIVHFVLTMNALSLVVAILFILAPFILYIVSRDIDHDKMELKQ